MTLLYCGEQVLHSIEHGLLVVCAILYIVTTVFDYYYR
jgi:hypothetical protein